MILYYRWRVELWFSQYCTVRLQFYK